MIETKIGGIDFATNSTKDQPPYVIGVFGPENSGKTRFALTGHDPIGCAVLEMKSWPTLKKDSADMGKKIFHPKDEMALIVGKRHVEGLKDDVERQRFYMEHTKKIEDVVFALMEHKDIGTVLIDKFTAYCRWKEFAINGLTPKFVKIDGQVRQSKNEVIQAIIDFLNTLAYFRKPVVLLCGSKADFEVLDSNKEPIRNTADCGSFRHLGSHVNMLVETITNEYWDVNKQGPKFNWRYALNVRTCQKRPELEGPLGTPLLKDEEIMIPRLIQEVDPELDLEMWM